MRSKRERSRPLVDVMLQELIQANGITRDPVLESLSEILDDNPRLVDLVHGDLIRGLSAPGRGRKGLSAEVVLRTTILMRVKNWTYREARDRLNDSLVLREFIRWGFGALPQADAINRAVLRLQPETIKAMNDAVVRAAVRAGIEDGARLRVDTTVTETDIHHPTDSSLLRDCVRTLTRLANHIKDRDPSAAEGFVNRLAATKKLARRIDEAARKRGDDRAKALKQHYKKLLGITQNVANLAREVARKAKSRMEPVLWGLGYELEHYLDLTEQVMVQTRRRIILEQTVPAGSKIVSIFEPHTQIIRRGKVRKPTEYGRKLLLSQGGSRLITGYAVLDGNPADVTLLEGALTEHQRKLGQAPDELACDRGFFSAENVALASNAGVKLVSIPKPGRKSQEQQQFEKTKAFRLAQCFRAGIEGTISGLKRGRGIARCTWHADHGFNLLIGLSILAYNLTLLAEQSCST